MYGGSVGEDFSMKMFFLPLNAREPCLAEKRTLFSVRQVWRSNKNSKRLQIHINLLKKIYIYINK